MCPCVKIMEYLPDLTNSILCLRILGCSGSTLSPSFPIFPRANSVKYKSSRQWQRPWEWHLAQSKEV